MVLRGLGDGGGGELSYESDKWGYLVDDWSGDGWPCRVIWGWYFRRVVLSDLEKGIGDWP